MASRPAEDSGEQPAGARSTGPLVVVLPRAPGSREARWAHLLGGPVEMTAGPARTNALNGPQDGGMEFGVVHGTSALTAEVASLRETVEALEGRVAALERSLAAVLG
jgi:uncharacterized protein YceH (UPF0502 family)